MVAWPRIWWTLHVTVGTEAAASGNFHVDESDTESVKGAALVSGAPYVGHTETSYDYDLGPGSEHTSELSVVLVRQAETVPNDDFHEHVLMHQTVNAAGVPTASVDFERSSC